MRVAAYIFLFSLFLSFTSLYCQTYPGGVTGSEVWYMADETDLGNGDFEDYSGNDVQIELCPGYGYDSALFNFNPSVYSDKLCLEYKGALEQSLNRSVFLVTEPRDDSDSYPHIGTGFNDYVPIPYIDSLSRNTYIIETQQGYASGMTASFSQHQNAHVHFYNWSNYDSDKKFKSYGQVGETTFTIGKKIPFPDLDNGPEFDGLLPEFVSYDRALTANERDRVESYLALKYGITKWEATSYRNSKNKVFWDQENNALFSSNIFGIGRDNLSGLNQLQCESAHARDYLVAAIYEIMDTNAMVQANYSIGNNNFLVFGDTGVGGTTEDETLNVERLNKVWLAEVTGQNIPETPVHFRLDLNNEFQPYINQILAEELKVWMLHDKHVNNEFVSDFDNGNVEFYEPFEIEETSSGEVYAHFKEEALLFDEDGSFFDQFTFAVGPDVLVQFRPRYDCREASQGAINCYELDIVITEGAIEGEPILVNENEEQIDLGYNDEQTQITGDVTYTATICAPMDYTATVNGASGGTFDFEYEAEVIGPYTIDLGPSVQYLTASQPEITLDAGQYFNDPEAVYKWYYNDEPITPIPGTDSILVVDEPGEYCVVVTTSDLVCEFEVCVQVAIELDANISCQSGFCDVASNLIDITITTGAPPFTVKVYDSSGQQVDQVVEESDYTIEISDIEEGWHSIVIEDSLGAVYEGSCDFDPAFTSTVPIGPDLVLNSANPQYTLDTDGVTSGWGNHTYTYTWEKDGDILPSSTGPQLVVDTPGEYRAIIYFVDFGCYGYATQTVDSELEVTLVQDSDCQELDNSLEVLIDYGFQDYTTDITGTEYPSGAAYSYSWSHSGNLPVTDIPYGDFDVTITDEYGATFVDEVEFIDPLDGVEIDLIQYLKDDTAVHACYVEETQEGLEVNDWMLCDCCGQGYIEVDGNPGTILDASQEITNPQNYTYEWFEDGVSTGIYTPEIFIGTIPPYEGGVIEISVKVTDINNGCVVEDSFLAYAFFGILEYNPPPSPPPSGYATSVYPNPSGSDATFHYNIHSKVDEVFSGKVEVFSMLGSLIFSNSISGQSDYTLPYRLVASGAYIIRTTTEDGTVTVDRIIIK